MIVAIASDHGGLKYKNILIPYIKQLDFEIIDCGTNNFDSCDYTDFGLDCALSVHNKKADLGIVICTTGIGMSIIANKVKGIRCALVTCVEAAKLTKEHNNSNMLALGASLVDIELTKEIVKTWLTTNFSNNERHLRRVEKIMKYEGEKNE